MEQGNYLNAAGTVALNPATGNSSLGGVQHYSNNFEFGFKYDDLAGNQTAHDGQYYEKMYHANSNASQLARNTIGYENLSQQMDVQDFSKNFYFNNSASNAGVKLGTGSYSSYLAEEHKKLNQFIMTNYSAGTNAGAKHLSNDFGHSNHMATGQSLTWSTNDSSMHSSYGLNSFIQVGHFIIPDQTSLFQAFKEF
jgi:hypothetical protein